MRYIKVDKDFVLNDEQFIKRYDHLWFHRITLNNFVRHD